MDKLKNKVAVITGGNSGIGLAAAILFAQQGAKVAITGRNQSSLNKAVGLIGHNAIGIVSDVAGIDSLTQTYDQVVKTFGRLDVLVVNAGISHGGPLADFTEQQFDEVSDINFKGA